MWPVREEKSCDIPALPVPSPCPRLQPPPGHPPTQFCFSRDERAPAAAEQLLLGPCINAGDAQLPLWQAEAARQDLLRLPPTLKPLQTWEVWFPHHYPPCFPAPPNTYTPGHLPSSSPPTWPKRASWLGPQPTITHHKQQLLHTLRYHVVKVAKVEVQGRPAHQLLLAQRTPVLGLHCMLGKCMSPHLIGLWAQETAVWTAEHLGVHEWWRRCQGGGDPPSPSSVLEHITTPHSQFRGSEPQMKASRHQHGSSQRQEAGSFLISLSLGQRPGLYFPVPSFLLCQPSPSILASGFPVSALLTSPANSMAPYLPPPIEFSYPPPLCEMAPPALCTSGSRGSIPAHSASLMSLT